MNRHYRQWLNFVCITFSIVAADGLICCARAQVQAVRLAPATPVSSATNTAKQEEKKDSPDKKTEGADKAGTKEKPEGGGKPGKDEKKVVDPAAERLSRIEKMTFDRKPSSILKAWAESSGVLLAKPKTAENEVDPNQAGLPGDVLVQIEAAKSGLASVKNESNEKESEKSKDDAKADGKKDGDKAKADAFEKELKELATSVTLGRWANVAERLAKMPPKEGIAAWRSIVKSLGEGQALTTGVIALAKSGNASTIPKDNGSSQSALMMQRFAMINNLNMGFNPNDPEVMALMQGRGGNEQHSMSVSDFISLTSAAIVPVEEQDREPLAKLVVLVRRQSDATEDLVSRLRELVERKEPKPVLSRRDAAIILCAANLAAEAEPFVLSPENPEAKGDPVELNLSARHALAKYNRLGTPELVNQAWSALQAVMALEVKTPEQSQARDEATRQAVSLVPKVDKALSKKWFEETFAGSPDRGVALLANLGESANSYLRTSIRTSEPRLQNMRMLKIAIDSLLVASPERADQWRESLTTLAAVWLAEARLTKAFDRSTAPRIQRDIYGNVYYSSDEETPNIAVTNPNLPQAIAAREIVDLAPRGGWLERVDRGLHPNIHKALAEIYLKMGGDSDAFPHIEEVARTEPEMARELAQEFVKVWTSNHDMNQAKNQRNPYIFIYGFEQKAESIPLTRSKQQRNLEELSGWLAKLKKLPIRPIDETLVARAFTTCHSSAEVYRSEAIESVFGPLENLKPETIARLAQQMRSNLAGLWRRPAVQDQAKTKRKEKDIREEVLRGYETALKVVDEARAKYPGEWSLTAAQAALIHDRNNFEQEIALSPDYMPVRRKALGLFAQAAAQYAKVAGSLPADRQTNDVFDQWFYAGLGACEPGQITETTVAETNQPALIREAMRSLPGAAAESHSNRFANQLFTRMSAIAPAVKFRYLKAGFEIVGDAPQAFEARKVYDYYKDLNREIRLESVVDGPTSIDPGQPFGVYVNIRHTREIERESGGFARYLQNQNQGSYFYYNYGRPLENYRDKFQEAATRALQEHFEVLSVTFETEKVASMPLPEPGWRMTPYAYLLLKPKSPKVDRIPQLKLDLDFMDTSGYVILPVESAPVAVNCDESNKAPRPFRDVQITQILDERQSVDGKLIIEIKSTGHGLMPSVGELVDLEEIPSFVVEKVEDQGLAVTQFDEESSSAGILSERTSLVTLKAASGLTELPGQLQFPRPKIDSSKIVYQKYVDADLAAAEAVTPLVARYGKVDRSNQVYAMLAALAAMVVAALAIPRLWKSLRKKPVVIAAETPAEPFAVLGLLRGLQKERRLTQAMQDELAAAIRSVEECYFAANSGSDRPRPELGELIVRWSSLAGR
ncbi:hypothetical protein GC170_09765 [bacterium]|nr:hypothetical protein [bacterium]